MKDKKNTKIQKESVEISKREAGLRKAREKNMCKCTHVKNKGDYSLVKDKSSNNPLHYKCTQCDKKIDITKLDEAKIDEALNIVDRMCDIIKMTIASSNKESDIEFVDKISNTQFRVRNDLKQAYNLSLKAQKDGKGRRSENMNKPNGSQWGKPESY